jgi:hypothetical protein
MATSSSKKSTKTAAVVTYIIALVCLIVGLFIPLFDGKEMLALKLPAAFNCLVGKTDADFTLSCIITIGSLKFDIMANIVVAYVIVTALGILALIPILLSSKTSGTAYAFAAIIEILAAIILSFYAIFAMYLYSLHALYPDAYASVAGKQFSYNLLIALAGVLLMLIIQGFACKKGGASKLFVFLFSAIAVICLFDVTVFIKALSSPVSKISETLKLSTLYIGASESFGFEFSVVLLGNFSSALAEISELSYKVLLIFACLLPIVVILNYLIDIIALGSKANSFTHFIRCFRYAIEIALIICLVVTLLVTKVSLGIYLVVIALMALLQFVISVVSACLHAKSKQRAKETGVSEKYYTNVPDAQPAPVADEQPKKVKKEKPSKAAASAQYDSTNVTPVNDYVVPQPQPQYRPQPQPQPQYYQPEEPTYENVYMPTYKGPVDSFIKKLNNNERIEFSKLFIDKSAGEIADIPEYIVGGDNKEFFSNVFIYLGRVRSLVSDGLLNKMYKEC